jgi:hypothetical protein
MLMLISSMALALAAPAMEAPASAGSNWQGARSHARLTQSARRTGARLRQWLVGSWDMACPSGADNALWSDSMTVLRPNGRFTVADGYGWWSVSGTRLSFRFEKHPSTVLEGYRLAGDGNPRVRIIGPNAMIVDWGRGNAIRFVRCG